MSSIMYMSCSFHSNRLRSSARALIFSPFLDSQEDTFLLCAAPVTVCTIIMLLHVHYMYMYRYSSTRSSTCTSYYMYSNTQSKAAHLFQEKCSLLFCSSSTCVKGEEGESPQETASPRVRVIIISFKLSSPCGFHSDVVEDVTWHMVFMCVRFLPDLLVGHFILCARYSSG